MAFYFGFTWNCLKEPLLQQYLLVKKFDIKLLSPIRVRVMNNTTLMFWERLHISSSIIFLKSILKIA